MKKKRTLLLLLFTMLLLLPFSVKADDEINITAVKCPVIGQKPTYVGGSTPYTDVYEERWVNLTDHVIMNSNSTFEAKKMYYYEYGYTLKSAYEGKYLAYPELYDDVCTYSFGGVGASPEDFTVNSVAFFTGTVESEEDLLPIFESVTFDVTAPTIGGTPPTIRTNSRYTVNSQKWINTTDSVQMSASDVFQANKKYKLIVNYSSLFYDDDIFANFNDSPYYLGTSYYEDERVQHIGQAITSAYFYFGDKEDLEIDGYITLGGNKAPVAGQTISDFTVSSNIPALHTEHYWTIATKNGNTTTYEPIDDPNAVFEVGKEYHYHGERFLFFAFKVLYLRFKVVCK